jgi:hypothetical protein
MEKEKKQNKKVYLANGEEVELLAQYQDRNRTEYVVKVIIGENCYEGETELIYENRIVSNVYENFKDTPMYLRKTDLENQIDELNKQKNELVEQKNELNKELKSAYNPRYAIDLPIFFTAWGNEIDTLKIVKIVFTEQEDKSFYIYYCNREYRNFTEIGDGYYLTKEEAEKARQKYLEEKKNKDRKRVEEEYAKAKKEFEELKKSF